MTRQRHRLYGLLVACTLVSGGVGFLLARHLTSAQFAAVAALWAVAGALAWWKWGAGDSREDIKRWLGYRRRRVRRLPLGVLGVLSGIAVVSSLLGFWGAEPGWKGFLQSLGPELGGAVVTYILLDLILGTRQLKETLIAQLGSNVKDVAVVAGDRLRREGWLSDGSLREAKLGGANLQAARLWRANLEGASLSGANLERARLGDAILRDASLSNANMVGADLAGADFEGADLAGAELRDAILRDASFLRANVDVRQLVDARTLAGATLQDGTKLSRDGWANDLEEWREKQEGRPEVERDDDGGYD